MSENRKETGILIEKYFEGLTTLEEEQCLREYFRKDTIPAELESYKAIFQFFTSERDAIGTNSPRLHEKKSRKIYLRWASVAAAACLLLYGGLKLTFDDYQTPETSCAYINGEAYTNLELIQSEALKSLENLSANNEATFAAQIEALEFLFE